MSTTQTWPETLRGVWEQYTENGYTVIIRNGSVYLFHAGAPRHCLATDIDRGRWIGQPAMSEFIHSHLYEDMAGAIEGRVLAPWRHVSAELTTRQVLEFRQVARDCYCYQGVQRCDFCTSRRKPDRATWEASDPEVLRHLLRACGYQQEAPCRFTHPTRGWAAIHGDGSAAGLPTIYYVTREK